MDEFDNDQSMSLGKTCSTKVNKMLVYLYQPSKLYSNTFVWISEKIFIIQNNQDGLGKYFRISKWSLSRHWQTRVSQNQQD